jgi:hypothetical protein
MPGPKPEYTVAKKAWDLYDNGKGLTPYAIAKLLSTEKRPIHRKTISRWIGYFKSGKLVSKSYPQK